MASEPRVLYRDELTVLIKLARSEIDNLTGLLMDHKADDLGFNRIKDDRLNLKCALSKLLLQRQDRESQPLPYKGRRSRWPNKHGKFYITDYESLTQQEGDTNNE